MTHQCQKTDSYSIWYKDTPTQMLLFVHGFGAANFEAYWGRLPNYLRSHSAVSMNYALWGYSTTKSLFPNALSFFQGKKRVADIGAITRSKCEFIYNTIEKYHDKRINIFAHSMGGIITLKALSELNIEKHKDFFKNKVKICLNATPVKANRFARLHSYIGWGANPHSLVLSDKRLNINVVNMITELRQLGVHISYMECIRDAIVPAPDSDLFDHYMTLDEGHTWFSDVKSRYHDGVNKVAEWVSR